MEVAALSLASVRMNSVDQYHSDLSALLKAGSAGLVVLPAYSSIVLGLSVGALMPASDFKSLLGQMPGFCDDWNRRFLDLHSKLARELSIFLAAGTLFESGNGRHFHTAYCFDPEGEICCKQRQTHLASFEREAGFSRGEELAIFTADGLQAGLVVGNDARHPEVGRIFALRGAGLLLHNGALEAGFNCWPQAAGMWAQVQQNQLWSVEAQLCGTIAGCTFGASSAVIGPCEITPGQSGYLARGYPQTPVVTAHLNESARRRIKQKYPLLGLLNPGAYTGLKYGKEHESGA